MDKILQLVAGKVIKKLGVDVVTELLKGTLCDGKITEATMSMIRKLNDGEITTKTAAHRVSKSVREAQEKLDKNNYSRTALEQIVQDALGPLMATVSKTAGLGVLLYNQILPSLLERAAQQKEAQIGNAWRQGTSTRINPLAVASAYQGAVNNFKGGTINAGLQGVGDIIQKASDIHREESSQRANREYYNDLQKAGGDRNWSAAQWDALGRIATKEQRGR